jgi:hypothetical protein
MERHVIRFNSPIFRAITIASGAAALLFGGAAAISYRFNWTLGKEPRAGSMPEPMWGCHFESGYLYVKRVSEKKVFEVGGEGTFILSVPPDIERSFHSLVGSSFGKEIWVTGNIFDAEARHEFDHYTVWASLWLLGAVFAILPLVRESHVILRRRALRLRELCTSCRYWLIGNQSGVCPECGTPIPEPQRSLLELVSVKIKPTDTRP